MNTTWGRYNIHSRTEYPERQGTPTGCTMALRRRVQPAYKMIYCLVLRCGRSNMLNFPVTLVENTLAGFPVRSSSSSIPAVLYLPCVKTMTQSSSERNDAIDRIYVVFHKEFCLQMAQRNTGEEPLSWDWIYHLDHDRVPKSSYCSLFSVCVSFFGTF